jgi:ketosteroid isomerase-like protein
MAGVGLGAALLCALPGPAWAQTSGEPGAILQQYADAINRGDAEAAAALHAPDAIVYSGSCWPCLTPVAVHDDIAADVQHHAHYTLHNLKGVADSASATFEVTSDATTIFGPIGVDHMLGTSQIRVRDGKIVTRDDTFDVTDPATRRESLIMSSGATDGQSLMDQSESTIVSFYAVWGDRAGEAWVAQHDGEPLNPADAGLPAPRPDRADEPAILVQRFVDAYNTGQPAAVTPLLRPDALVFAPGNCSPCLPPMVANMVKADARAHMRYTLANVQTSGQTVQAQVEMRSDDIQAAAPVGVARVLADVRFEVSDGLIHSLWIKPDLTDEQTRMYVRAPQVMASDGQSLAAQDPDTMASFVAVYGDRAPDAWVDQHEMRIASSPVSQ